MGNLNIYLYDKIIPANPEIWQGDKEEIKKFLIDAKFNPKSVAALCQPSGQLICKLNFPNEIFNEEHKSNV